MLRRIRLVLSVLAILSWIATAAPRTTHAQGDPAQTLKVEAQTVESHYPDTVVFTLKTSGFTAQDAFLSVYDPNGDLLALSERLEVANAPSASVSLSYTLSIQDQYLPPDTDLEYTWTLEDANGSPVDTPKQKLTLIDERFTWKSATDATNNVTVHWHSGLDDFGTEVIDAVNNAIPRIQPILGAKPKGRTSIWIYAEQTELFRVFPNGIIDWAGGFALSQWGLILVDIPEGRLRTSVIRSAIPHEVTHLAFDVASSSGNGDKGPLWMNEGLATYFETGSRLPSSIPQAVHDSKLIPLSELDDAFARAHDLTEAQLAYDESKSIIDFIIKDPRYGPDKITKTLNAFRNGFTSEEAFQKGMGSTPEELQSRWLTSVGATSKSLKSLSTKPRIPTDGGFLGLIPAMFCLGTPVLIFLVWLPAFLRRRRMRNLES